jgi:predicted methyltransferase
MQPIVQDCQGYKLWDTEEGELWGLANERTTKNVSNVIRKVLKCQETEKFVKYLESSCPTVWCHINKVLPTIKFVTIGYVALGDLRECILQCS